MRKVAMSTLLALLLIAVLAFAVYSQKVPLDNKPQAQVLKGGISQQVPVSITLLVSTETGVQTVTVPLVLNLNLSIGPVNAVGLDVKAEPGTLFISPITTTESISPTTSAQP